MCENSDKLRSCNRSTPRRLNKCAQHALLFIIYIYYRDCDIDPSIVLLIINQQCKQVVITVQKSVRVYTEVEGRGLRVHVRGSRVKSRVLQKFVITKD